MRYYSVLFVATVFLVLLCSNFGGQAVGQLPKPDVDGSKTYLPPAKVSVLPIIHVPKGVARPGKVLTRLIDQHVLWSQKRYQELLGTTFEIASKTRIFRGRFTVEQYETFANKVGAHITSQHLAAMEVNRFNCPYVLLTIFHHPTRDWPSGRGGSMNGGFNTGGGTALLSSRAFTHRPNGQSTLQHELGHAFGLPHVDAYGYQLKSNSPSIMAYNPAHHTKGLLPSSTPGRFIPEDLRGLALNQRVFPGLKFDAKQHTPNSYQMHPKVHSNGAGIYPGQIDYAIQVSTDAGAAVRSRVKNCVLSKIELSSGEERDPKTGQQAITYNPGNMWHTETIAKVANVDLTFPFPVRLSGIRVYSGHSGVYHPAKSARFFSGAPQSGLQLLADTTFKTRDASLNFPATESKSWRLELTPGKSKRITIRGIRFNSEGTEIFPPHVCLVK